MHSQRAKIAAVFLLALILGAFTHCGKPTVLVFKSNVYGGSDEASYEAFSRTVYPLTSANCASCHGSDIQPFHAAPDKRVAHDAVISSMKVNFANVSASRLVAKLRDENHNCWEDCVSNGAQMEAAIQEWKDAIDESGTVAAPRDLAVYTDETSALEAEFADAGNAPKSNSVRLTIQAATLRAPMVLTTPTGSDAYLSVPTTANTTLANNDPAAGIAYFSFRVPANGQYRVFGLAQAPNATDDSFFVNVINAQTGASVSGGNRQWDIPVSTRFDWRQVPNVTPNLVAGTTYTLEVRQREDGARLAGLIVTADPAFNGQEIGDFFGITLAFDLSRALGIPDVHFLIDVIDYDLYSYKFSRPRIVTRTQPIYAKGIKVYLNGIWGPQHSNYTIVDKIVTPTDGALSTFSMIVLKDKGLSADQVKFSFDQLTVAVSESAGGAGAGGATGGVSPQTSLMAFQETVYPISRSSAYSCVGCHMNVSPRHASDNALTAHDAVLGVVNFTTPADSAIVRKMRVDRHNCGANCENLATMYQSAIEEWRNRRTR